MACNCLALFPKATSCKLLAVSLFLVKKLVFPLGEISKCAFENDSFSYFGKTKLAPRRGVIAAHGFWKDVE